VKTYKKGSDVHVVGLVALIGDLMRKNGLIRKNNGKKKYSNFPRLVLSS
jgi:hypothetical protein